MIVYFFEIKIKLVTSLFIIIVLLVISNIKLSLTNDLVNSLIDYFFYH